MGVEIVAAFLIDSSREINNHPPKTEVSDGENFSVGAPCVDLTIHPGHRQNLFGLKNRERTPLTRGRS